jgi:hypothetical protein
MFFPDEEKAFNDLKARVDNIERVLRQDPLIAAKLDHPEGKVTPSGFSVPATANA